MSNSGTTAFPAGLDSYDPIGTATYEDDVGYDQLTIHNQTQYAIEAIEAKIGIDSSAVITSHDYKLSGVTGTDKAMSKTGTETATNKTFTTPIIASFYQDAGKTKLMTTPDTASDTLSAIAATQTLTNKTISTGCALDANADANFTYNSLFRQAIINGNFDVWQRGTSFTTGAGYTADRWHLAAAGASATLAQAEETTYSGDKYYAVVTNPTNVTACGLRQMIETPNSLKLLGQKLTISLDLRKQASQTGNIVVYIQHSTTVDAAYNAAVTTAATLTVTAAELSTTDWTSFSVTTAAVIPNTAKTIFVQITNNQAGGANVGYHIRKVQLCAGDVALPFMPKNYEEELRACQRYYEKSHEYATAPADVNTNKTWMPASAIGTDDIYTFVTFKVRKRIVPTMTFYSDIGGTAVWGYWNGGWESGTATVSNNPSETGCAVKVTRASEFTSLSTYIAVGHYTASAEL